MDLSWRRFPKTRQQIRQRVIGRPIFVNGIPKCGTHLLEGLFTHFPELVPSGFWSYFDSPSEIEIGHKEKTLRVLKQINKGSYCSGHLVPKDVVMRIMKNRDYRTVLIIRDPRELVCSHVFHALNRETYRFHKYYQNELESEKDRLMASIIGIPAKYGEETPESIGQEPLIDIGERYALFMPWLSEEINLTVRFEELIGPMGGGDLNLQVTALTKILNHIGISYSQAEISEIAGFIYNPKSITFNKGKIGRWKRMFDKEHKKIFKELAGDLLIELGYEENYDW